MKKLLLTLGAIASVAAPVAAVVACGTTPAKTPTHLDEGFNNASLIENFNIADEASTEKIINEYSIDGKEYDITDSNEANSFVEEWKNLLNSDKKITDKLFTYKNLVPSLKSDDTLTKILVSAEVKSGKVTIGFVNQDNQDISTSLGGPWSKDITKFKDAAGGALQFPEYQNDWVTSHKFKDSTTKTKVAPKKTDSINSILYTQANKLTSVEKTDHDKVTIIPADASAYIRKSSADFDLLEYDPTKVAAQQPLAAEFHKGDKLNFTFNNSSDIASFTERVKYIDTYISGYAPSDKLFEGHSNANFEVIKEANGYEVVASTGDDVVFSLVPSKKNVVTLTFKDFPAGFDHIGVFLGLLAFEDTNKDGKIDKNDESMTNQFVTDASPSGLSSRYTSLVHKDTFIYGYTDEANVK